MIDVPDEVKESKLYKRCMSEGIKLVDGRYIYSRDTWNRVKSASARHIGDIIDPLVIVGVDIIESCRIQYRLRKNNTPVRWIHYIWKCPCGSQFTSSRVSSAQDSRKACRNCTRCMSRGSDAPIDVYMLYADWCKAYKIGITTNIQQRLYILNKACPTDITPYYVRNGINKERGIKLEKSLHTMLQSYHLKGEWYIIPEKYVPAIKNIIKYAYGKVGPE